MLNLKPGDQVSCRIRLAIIVDPNAEYDEIQSFVIVASSSNGYYLYVPHYYFLKEVEELDRFRQKSLGIEKRYLNENITYIEDGMIVRVDSKQDGLACKICHDFYPYATINQEDGSMVCYSCRQNPY